jgi:hypothetical protein
MTPLLTWSKFDTPVHHRRDNTSIIVSGVPLQEKSYMMSFFLRHNIDLYFLDSHVPNSRKRKIDNFSTAGSTRQIILCLPFSYPTRVLGKRCATDRELGTYIYVYIVSITGSSALSTI